MYLVDDKVFRYRDCHYEQGCDVEEQKSVKRSPLRTVALLWFWHLSARLRSETTTTSK